MLEAIIAGSYMAGLVTLILFSLIYGMENIQ